MRIAPIASLIPIGLVLSLPAAAQPNRPWAKLCLADADAYTGCTIKGTKRMVAVCIPKGAKLEPTGEDDKGNLKMTTPKLAFIRYRIGTVERVRLVMPIKRQASAATFQFGLVTYAAGWASTFVFTHKGDKFRLVERNLAGERDKTGRRARDVTHYFELANKDGRTKRYRCSDDNQK